MPATPTPTAKPSSPTTPKPATRYRVPPTAARKEKTKKLRHRTIEHVPRGLISLAEARRRVRTRKTVEAFERLGTAMGTRVGELAAARLAAQQRGRGSR